MMMMIWFGAATTLLSVLFARGVEQTRAGGRGYARALDAELKIDLLRLDTLAVLGRFGARSALVWFVVSAVACLFFVGGDLNWLTILLIAACAAMGVGLFVSIMSRIHRQIAKVKGGRARARTLPDRGDPRHHARRRPGGGAVARHAGL